MHVFRKCLFTILILASTNVIAESYRLNANYFVRSSPDFGRRDRNKVGVLTRGTTFKVVRTVAMANGAEALEINVKALSGTSHVQPSENYWIYKSKDSHFIRTDPRDTQAGSVDVPCTNCGGAPQNRPGNASDLADVSTTITRQDNEVPDEDVAGNVSGSFDAQIRKYSSSPEVENAINYALRLKTRRSRGECYRSVKNALALSGTGNRRRLIPSWYGGIPARSAREALKRYGFVNLLDSEPYKSQLRSPSQAPKGAVLIYSSGIPCKGSARQNPDCGHIEIKTGRSGDNAYVSDYSSATAINETPRARRYGSRYRLIGVMFKPLD